MFNQLNERIKRIVMGIKARAKWCSLNITGFVGVVLGQSANKDLFTDIHS